MLLVEVESVDRKVLDTLEHMMANRRPTWWELAREVGMTFSEVRESFQRLNRHGLVSWNPCLQRSFVLMNSHYEETPQ